MSDVAAPLPVNRLRIRRLQEFVDRWYEMERFVHVLETDESPVMVVSATTGMGKTSLLMRMVHECSLRGLPKAEVTWTDTLVYDYTAVLRRMRDELGAGQFSGFTDLVNYYTDADYSPRLDITVKLQGGGLTVGQGASFTDSQTGDIAGIVLRDNMFVVQRQDLSTPLDVRRAQLTGRFIDELRALSGGSQVVLFFDAVEKMAEVTKQWLWEQLLTPIIEGALPKVRAIVLGQSPPPDDRNLIEFLERVELKPLDVPDIKAYLKKRVQQPMPEDICTALAHMLHTFTSGRPGDVALASLRGS